MDQERLHTIAGLRAAGKSQRQIEAATGIPRTTVRRALARPEAAQLINEIRPQILLSLSERLLDRVSADDWAPSDVVLGTLYGIVHDKHTRHEAAQQPAQDNRTLVIVIPGLEAGIDPTTIEGRHTPTPSDTLLGPDILPPSD